MKTRRIYAQVDQETYDRAREAAEADRRSMANWLSLTIERAVEDKTPEPAES